MKRIILLYLLFLPFLIVAQNSYYYYKGNKVNLTENQEYLNIIIDGDTLNLSSNLKKFKLEKTKDKQSGKVIKVKFSFKPDKSEYTKAIDSLKKENKHIKLILPYFERNGAEPIGISDIFYVKLKNINDVDLLNKEIKKQKVQIIKQVPYMDDWYILSIENSSFESPVDASNYFYETGLFDNVDPAFNFDFKTNCVNDPLFNQQWGLNNTAYSGIDVNACNAWTITRGSGIIVAVVDQGIDPNHNDLKGNLLSLSFDAKSGKSPSVFNANNYHGTHVAGIVAAIRNNNLQVVGVAPEAKILPVSHDLYLSSTISSELASGINWAWQNGADVITNSWGDQGGAYYGQMHSTILENAITDAMTQGRGGKGCVVLFAAGNYGDYQPVMDYPGNFSSDILTVGSIDNNGKRSSFSGYGDNLDVVAPGNNILSTLPNNSTGILSGTSMATPHVAGIAALVLSVNPNFTRKQVVDRIESTAKKVGGYSYQTNSRRSNGLWYSEMGYGLVDAYLAVSPPCVNDFTNQTITFNMTVNGCNTLNVKDVIVTNNATLTLIASGDINIDNFEVQSGTSVIIK
jgi:subtilisin family serine protease